MSPFADKIRQFIYQYKQILKRYLSASAYDQKTQALQIKRKNLKGTTDVDLYEIAHRLVYDIEHYLATKHLPASEYSGVQSFQQHFKDFLQGYALKQDKVVNLLQSASKATINAIQLLSLPPNQHIAEKLQQNILTLRKFGNRDQIEMLKNALQKKRCDQQDFYLPFIDCLQDVTGGTTLNS